jgi:hypothetical protein
VGLYASFGKQDAELDEADRWPGDPALAEVMRLAKAKAPVEQVERTDALATAFNMDKLGTRNCIVDLACGHKAVVRYGSKTARCKSCHAMIMRGADYDAFRNRRD